ncbi:MAG TPA: hypothetical protein ENJ40_10150 [Thermosulfurimonas dismutans]|uniref:DUS-like FMN-binding domain-containing protein n=1 Tax=Thermosulfurimonas dismutans TaxID=999894 RepID=A0A7C3CML0_9BACT|nr:hypothetical protein [Thermosulfurimonas dismutans]
MDGLTHAAFRRLVASYGSPDLLYTEMVSVRAGYFHWLGYWCYNGF